jgi:hypothetical protein
MTYRVCIPTAGTGSRLGELTRFINKSLVSIANRPTISHLIEQFPSNTKFVIALGHKGHLVREFLGLTYPNMHFDFVEVELFEGNGSGLGLSLLACKKFLQEPFIFNSCDTLVDEIIPPPDKNWVGYATISDLQSYRTIAVDKGQVTGIYEKGFGKSGMHKPYIGLSGIHDYEDFWLAFQAGGAIAIQTGESHGLRALLHKGISAQLFTWHDTGSINGLNEARSFYHDAHAPNILEKTNEAIWFIGDQVVKFSDNEKFIANRVRRAQELDGFVPKVTGSGTNMYRYSKAEGKVFSEAVNLPLFEKLLGKSAEFWRVVECNGADEYYFKNVCMHFYREKTYERVEMFYKNFSRSDGIERINGIEMPLLADLLSSINWDWLSDGMPGRFHGDFHFENILWSQGEERFIFLDWRQDFGGSLSVGDIYYDFAKLLHGLIINHGIIARNLYSIQWSSECIDYDFCRKEILVECQNNFSNWLKFSGYDEKKVIVLTALIFLNIAALHHDPYALLLYALGKKMLKNGIEYESKDLRSR